MEIYDEQGNVIDAYNEDGDPVDVFGQEEVDEKVIETKEELTAKVEEVKAGNEEALSKKDKEIEQIKKDIKEGEEGDKAKNLTGLRKAKEEAEKDKEVLKAELETFKKETNEKIAGIHGAVSSKKIDDALVKAVGDDKEMQDKARIHFNRIKPIDSADAVKVEEDFNIRIKEAVILAGGGGVANAIGNVAGTEGGYVPAPKSSATHESPKGELADMGKKHMDITDKDIRDHKKAKE